jgi:hypothetical protein
VFLGGYSYDPFCILFSLLNEIKNRSLMFLREKTVLFLSVYWFLTILFTENVFDPVLLNSSLMSFIEQLSGRLLDENQVRAISDEIKNVIIASATRKRDRTERTKAEDFDADEGELLKEENEQEEEVFDQVFLCEMILFY